jgi:hypothetical protein
MTLTPEQLAEQALRNITGENIGMFYVVKVAEAIRQAIDEERQFCILDAQERLSAGFGQILTRYRLKHLS